MSTITYSAPHLPEPVSKGHANRGVGETFKRKAARMWAAFIEMQDRRAQDYALPCLAQMSAEQLKELGYTPADIRAIAAHRHIAPPYWV